MLSIRITDFYSHSCQGEDWTAAFAAAIQTVSSLGGGTIYIPSGVYPSRSIELSEPYGTLSGSWRHPSVFSIR